MDNLTDQAVISLTSSTSLADSQHHNLIRQPSNQRKQYDTILNQLFYQQSLILLEYSSIQRYLTPWSKLLSSNLVKNMTVLLYSRANKVQQFFTLRQFSVLIKNKFTDIRSHQAICSYISNLLEISQFPKLKYQYNIYFIYCI